MPLRERNALLLAGGYAPAYPEHSLDEPELARLRVALRQILTGHEPYPALVVNRWWEMLDGNAAVAVLLVHGEASLRAASAPARDCQRHRDQNHDGDQRRSQRKQNNADGNRPHRASHHGDQPLGHAGGLGTAFIMTRCNWSKKAGSS